MSSVVIVAGCPGSGKTTVCRALAASDPLGLHLVSDQFYEFIPHVIDPSTPASREQNLTIMRALGASAAQFARGGYTVFLDGVIGPWMLPELRPFLEPAAPVHYVLLQVPLAEALDRVARRQGPGLSPSVRHMHGQFADPGAFERFGVETAGVPPAELLRRVQVRLLEGALAMDWSLVGVGSEPG